MKRFPSIKKNGDFRRIYKTGKSKAAETMVMYVDHRGSGRIGITASKKIGNSIVRHTFVRKIREIYRLNKPCLAEGKDIIVVARVPAAGAGYGRLEKDYMKLLKVHGILVD